MSLYKPKGTQFWWVNLSHCGERVRRSTGATDRAEAQRVHNEIQTELWRAKPVTGKKTWGEAVLAWCRVKPRSESELLSLRKFAERFRDRPLAEVTADDVDKALSFCESAGTYTRYRTMIAAVLKLAVTNGWLDRAPVLHKREGRKPKRRAWLTPAQWDALYRELPEHQKPAAFFALLTGLRQANVLGLTWDRVDLQRALVWVEAEDTKADEPLSVPLAPEAVALLHARQVAQKEEAERLDKPLPAHVFTLRLKPFGEIKTAFIAACVRAGVGEYVGSKYSGFTWHGLRHTWATWHAQAGTPLDVLKELGGWADLRMLLNYRHHTPNHLARYAGNNLKVRD